MTETRKPKEPEVLNPRYAGATPEMVARALGRREVERQTGETDAEPTRESGADGEFQSGI